MEILYLSLLLQLTEDDNFIGVRTVVPHVVGTSSSAPVVKWRMFVSLCSELSKDDDLVGVV